MCLSQLLIPLASPTTQQDRRKTLVAAEHFSAPASLALQCAQYQRLRLLCLQTCSCQECKDRAAREGVPAIQHTPTEFERHSGMAASKKWKYTVRVLTQRGTVTLGQWLEGHGIQSKYTRCAVHAWRAVRALCMLRPVWRLRSPCLFPAARAGPFARCVLRFACCQVLGMPGKPHVHPRLAYL
jgi:hypothetical protein